MQCFTELTPPTAVTHSLNLPFTSADAYNLVVARTSLLQIYSLKTISVEVNVPNGKEGGPAEDGDITDTRMPVDDGFDSSFIGDDSVVTRSEHADTTKLILIAEYALSGTVTSMVSIKTLNSRSGGHSVLLGFRDAKLSLVEWDPEVNGLSTVSIHYYEQEEFEGSPWAPKLGDCVNFLAVDPGSRCAALKFGVRNLAILPFRQRDEDTAMDDWDEDLDGPRPENPKSKPLTNGDASHQETASAPSFVLRLSSLDPSLIHPIHLAFLYEYREPTFGILSSTQSPSYSLLQERKDHLSYTVFTLDLQQKASTTILAVSGLPYDLLKVIPLPAPIGGALLVGDNELIHVDQSGKSNGVAVNSFARQCTSFGLADQSNLEMRLEGSAIDQLSMDNGTMLIILSTGELAILSFRLDGRTVSGLSVRRVSEDFGGRLVLSRASSLSVLPRGCIFVGSEDADSVVIGWTKKTKGINRRRSQAQDDAFEDELPDDLDDDDDLYGDAPVTAQPRALSGSDSSDSPDEYKFRIHDSLVNIAPLRDVTLSRLHISSLSTEPREEILMGNLTLVGASGRNRGGALSILKREIEPQVIGRFDFPEARAVWTINAKRPFTKALQPEKSASNKNGDVGLEPLFDRLMLVSKADENNAEESAVYVLTAAGFESLTGTEFDPEAGGTIEAGTLGNGMRIIQVLRSEVRSYDGDLGLAQILPMFDEETGLEPKILSASIVDPFLLVIRDDSSIFVARCDDNNELEEVERIDDALLANKWLSGCLYADTTGIFAAVETDKGVKEGENILMCLLSAEGALHMYSLPDLSKAVYILEGVCFIPPTLSPTYRARRATARETLTEILLADLGDETSKSPFLILRAANDDITLYEPYRLHSNNNSSSLLTTLYFSKVPNPHLAKDPIVAAEETADSGPRERDLPMRALSNVGGYTTVSLPGGSPSLIIKSSKSIPRVIGLRGTGVRDMSSFHTAGCYRGFIYVDTAGVARVSQLPPDTNYTEVGMALKKLPLGEEVNSVTYHPPMDVYVIGTSALENFELPADDDYHREWQQEHTDFPPRAERGFLKVISPQNWSIIDVVELEPCEVVMCLKSLNLETSEETHERRQLITVGTAICKGEDLAVRGRISVFDIVTVVPEPGRPETNKKLKLIAREEIPRGAITAVSEIGTQGFMIVAQGQKCMVRGLKEDGTLLPVAFMDMSTYVTCLKELPGTGLCVFADALKGVWLAGYAEEPYKMTLFGKQSGDMEILCAEVFPIGSELFIVVADSDCNLHVLQFDPEHPKSIQGQILLQRTTFSLGGHLPSTMNLLPRTKPAVSLPATADLMDTAVDNTIADHEILITNITGSISLLTPLSESQYRRLSTLTNHLSNTLFQPAGLNPKAYRINSQAPEPVIGGRPVVDGTILMRWTELGSQRRAEISARVGVDVEQIRDDLEELRSGVLYL